MPLKTGPLKSLLDPKDFFLNNKSNLDFILDEKDIYLLIKFVDEEGNSIPSSLKLHFNKTPLFLKGWTIIDTQRISTKIKINKVVKEQKLLTNYGSKMFQLTEEMRNTGDVYRGPWKRKLILPPATGRGVR